MEVRIQSIHFDASEQLQSFVQKKVAKLEKFYDDIKKVEVSLKVVKPETAENKEAGVKVLVPNGEFYANKVCDTFEEAVDLCLEALEKQLVKHQSGHRAVKKIIKPLNRAADQAGPEHPLGYGFCFHLASSPFIFLKMCNYCIRDLIFLKENFKTICRYFLSRLSLSVHFQAHRFCTHQTVFRRPISRTMFAFIFTNCGRLFQTASLIRTSHNHDHTARPSQACALALAAASAGGGHFHADARHHHSQHGAAENGARSE